MGMPIIKEVGAQWLTSLYNYFHTKKDIIINGFKDTGIIEVVQMARNEAARNEGATNNNIYGM